MHTSKGLSCTCTNLFFCFKYEIYPFYVHFVFITNRSPSTGTLVLIMEVLFVMGLRVSPGRRAAPHCPYFTAVFIF